ncbi:MAG: serine hydroxymethyltransferase [Alphaproteobacteria bacterium GM7ARS4]|nr:serine hydroxymethyltransferase [Alphaproteobacteria bacterium GM7ARS4]
MTQTFFQQRLKDSDAPVFGAISKEHRRQSEQIELIASENIVSQAVMDAQGTLLTNKYAEGYSGRRYYGGCEHVDELETMAIERVCQLFGCRYANVQPHSGSQANQAVFLALIRPGDVIMGMSLAAGGHLTHGAPPNASGKWFKAVSYGVDEKTHLIDYDAIEALAKEHKPALLIAGGSAYSRPIDFERFRAIADTVGAYLLVDMAHFAGLVACGLHPDPLPHAHVVTSTTHKTLRGPRGGIILTNHEDIAKKINSAVFPGLQGGPLMHVIAAKAVAFGEALGESYKAYMKDVVENARTLASVMEERGVHIITGGTDTHLMLVDLRPKKLTGNVVEASLERAGMTCNKNGVPFDPEKPFVTSGIRLGTPAATSRGFDGEAFRLVGAMIGDVLDSLVRSSSPDAHAAVEKETLQRVKDLCARYPIYPPIYPHVL